MKDDMCLDCILKCQNTRCVPLAEGQDLRNIISPSCMALFNGGRLLSSPPSIFILYTIK